MFKYFILLLYALFPYVNSHGYLWSPVNRASLWRVNDMASINYNDNELFCGGRFVQWEENKGQCGLCGDNYADPVPRKYELGGDFGLGIIVEIYTSGKIIPVDVLITANHLGYFNFSLCNLDKYVHESEECFKAIPLKMSSGDDRFYIDSSVGIFNVSLQLPETVQCDHCVFRWTYTVGNSWGECEDGSFALGCGPQETFQNCADIAIVL